MPALEAGGEARPTGELTELILGMSTGAMEGYIAPSGHLLLIAVGAPEWSDDRLCFPFAVRSEG